MGKGETVEKTTEELCVGAEKEIEALDMDNWWFDQEGVSDNLRALIDRARQLKGSAEWQKKHRVHYCDDLGGKLVDKDHPDIEGCNCVFGVIPDGR